MSLILQDSPKDRQLILCILARSNTVPTRITFNPNTDYPTFYGYSNSKIPLYLMGKGMISNVPREGYAKRLLSSHYLSYAETVINGAKNWDIHQKGMSISKFITLDNKTVYKDAEVFLVFRDKALDYIKDYATSHNEEVSSFLGIELSGEVSKTVTSSEVYYPQTIPDKTRGFERLVRKASEREHQRNLDERKRREDAKNARILASKEDKYLHAVNLIIEHREAKDNPIYLGNGNDPTSFSIPYYFFNFEDHIKIRDLLEAFLFKLKNAGCFESFDRSPATPLGSDVIFHKINLEKLKEYRDTILETKSEDKNGDLKTRYNHMLEEMKSSSKHQWAEPKKKYEEQIAEVAIDTPPISTKPKFPLPDDVEWKPGEDENLLSFKDGRILKFINPKKPTAKYFKLLIENHGQEVKHNEVPKHIENITKDQIENLIKALRKKINNAKLSKRIKITTNYEGGYILLISSTK